MSVVLPEALPGERAGSLVHRVGEVFAVFDRQDSGCVSYGLLAGGERLFVKTATIPAAMGSLRSAVRFHGVVRHPVIVPLMQVQEAADSPILVYPWIDGEVLYHPTTGSHPDRTAPDGPWSRFRSLPVSAVEAAIDHLLDAHRAVATAGFVAVDLYDGSMMYDFTRQMLRLIDLDAYRPGPFVAHERLPGSRRFMSPEEHGGGSVIDERSTVYVLGRAIRLLLDAGDDEAAWRGSPERLEVVTQATQEAASRRFGTVAELQSSWRAAGRRRRAGAASRSAGGLGRR